MFMDPATDVVLPFNWCACSVLLYLCALVLAACAVCAIEEGRSLYWTPADKWLTGVIGDWCWGKEDRGESPILSEDSPTLFSWWQYVDAFEWEHLMKLGNSFQRKFKHGANRNFYSISQELMIITWEIYSSEFWLLVENKTSNQDGICWWGRVRGRMGEKPYGGPPSGLGPLRRDGKSIAHGQCHPSTPGNRDTWQPHWGTWHCQTKMT